MSKDVIEFAEMRPRLLLLLELYANAATDEARATLRVLFEDVFLATAWNIATDLLDNGWQPTLSNEKPSRATSSEKLSRATARLRVV